MIKRYPKILAHKSAIKKGNFVTPEYIISKNKLLRRYCPHRQYPLGEIGTIIDKNITCNFHGFSWTTEGNPTNNNRQLSCGEYQIGESGLIFTDFQEPDASWVTDLKTENLLEYSHSTQGYSKGSWLWIMEIQSDLLHIRNDKDSVHKNLSKITNLNEIKMYDGEGWVLQKYSNGWWLCIFPYTFIEYSKGCLAINYTIPEDYTKEFGFNWTTQFYFDPLITNERKKEFEFYIEPVFIEDVAAIEKQKGPWYPLLKSSNRLEDHCVHFGKWINENLKN